MSIFFIKTLYLYKMARFDSSLVNNPNCVEDRKIIFTWDGAGFCWDNVRTEHSARNVDIYCWDDFNIVITVKGGTPVETMENYANLEKKEKEHFITLVCKVKGYPETEETKKKVEREITIDDIEFTIQEVLKTMNVKIIKD